MTCKQCGTDNGDLKKTCSNCGAFLEGRTINNISSSNQVIANISTASQLKNYSIILSTNGDKDPTIKIGEGYFWYRGEKIEDTQKVYELFADFLIRTKN